MSDWLANVTGDLEALKQRLIAMARDDITPEETQAMAREISAIRLQLKRLAFERQAMEERLRKEALIS